MFITPALFARDLGRLDVPLPGRAGELLDTPERARAAYTAAGDTSHNRRHPRGQAQPPR